jgi:nucleoside phosphorylase
VWLRCVAACVFALALSSCGDDNDAPPPTQTSDQVYAIFSAFPAEMALLVEHATVKEERTIKNQFGRDLIFRRGELGGVQVVIALTGIGLVNAAEATNILLDNFDVAGIIFSGVAGSPLPLRIGDVAVAESWELDEGPRYPVDPDLLAIAQQVEAEDVTLERCTIPPAPVGQGEVCLDSDPVVRVGGFGHSADDFDNMPYPCNVSGNDIFACDISPTPAVAGIKAHSAAAQTEEEPISADMETASVARVAAAHNVPFIAFRAVSDGAGDPLNLPPFPGQFFAYYRLAGHNAALATIAFLERLAAQ